MSHIETQNYTRVEAGRSERHLRVYALSTCAFCERALAFLQAQGLSHEFLMIDTLDPEAKRALKAELKEKYGSIPVFPLLIVDGASAVSGFTEERWREAIGL